MIAFYTFDQKGVFSGVTAVDPSGRLPRGTTVPPPAVALPSVAVFGGGSWVVVNEYPPDPAPDIPALKLRKNSEINAARLAANQSTFPYSGREFSCDSLSRGDIDAVNGYVSLTGGLPPGWPGGWKAVDNSVVALADVTAWALFYGAMVQAGNFNFAHAQALKAQLLAATTVAEIEAIKW